MDHQLMVSSIRKLLPVSLFFLILNTLFLRVHREGWAAFIH